MIEGIDIKYYQSHLDTSIDFHPGTTAITGLSMDGKTAILRAFEQLRTNRPLGTKAQFYQIKVYGNASANQANDR